MQSLAAETDFCAPGKKKKSNEKNSRLVRLKSYEEAYKRAHGAHAHTHYLPFLI